MICWGLPSTKRCIYRCKEVNLHARVHAYFRRLSKNLVALHGTNLIENNGHFRIFILGIKIDRKTDRLTDG